MTIDSTNPAADPARDPAEERFDPGEAFDINRYPPATAEELALAHLYHDLAVPPPPADAWQPLLDDLADRDPATRAPRAQWTDLARRVRETAVPPVADSWAARQTGLQAALAHRQKAFDAHAAWLAAQTRALTPPPPSAEQWAFQTEALQINLARTRHASDRIETLTRETPVTPGHIAPEELHSDWQAVEAAIRQGHTETPPPVAPQRWDRLWNRIHDRIDPQTAVSSTSAAGRTPQSAAESPLPTSAPTLALRPRHRLLRWAASGLAAAAAVALLAVTLWHHPGHPVPHTGARPAAQTAELESAEILDLGTVDDSVTTVVRTTSGDNPVTVVVIVNQ